ncbi:MAG TPA: cytochrome P450 [Xanthobacteraceae bacterium]
MLTRAAHPARIEPPEQRLSTFRLLRTVVDNPVKAWPAALYRERLYRSRVLGRDTLYVMEPELIRRVLVEGAEDFEKGEIARRALGPALGDAILTADGARWRWQRRAVASIFRHERILGFVPAMIASAARTLDRFRSYPAAAEIDIAREMMRTTFEIILSTIVAGRAGIDRDLMERSINQYLESTSWIVALGMVRAPRWVPYPGIRRTRRARDHLHRVLDGLIEEASRDRGEREDLLSLLMQATDPETGRSMDEMDVRYNLLTFITAGHETTAVALTWTFYLLSLHPHVEQRVRHEIAAVTGGAPLGPEHVEALAYTRQVIQESMRLYPPAALIVRAARRDLQLDGQEVRAGTTVYVPVYAVHRHEAYWHDPDAFDPGRFEPETAQARDRYTYLPFGAGPRVCIGQAFAQLEATAVLATIVSGCRLQLRPGYLPEPRLRVTLRPAAGMPMRIADLSDASGMPATRPTSRS